MALVYQPQPKIRRRRGKYLLRLIRFFCKVPWRFVKIRFTLRLINCVKNRSTSFQAGQLNTMYFVTYLTGRIMSIPLSKYIHPRTILTVSLAGCLATSTMLLFCGDSNPYFLYLGTGLMGFFICFQFPSGLSWLAGMLPDIKPHHMSLIFIGGTSGTNSIKFFCHNWQKPTHSIKKNFPA